MRKTPTSHLATFNAASALLALGAALAFPAAARASDVDAPAAPVAADAAVDTADIAEITVTARRREESAQDVPIALSVVDANTLEATGNFTLGQVQQLVPSLQVFSFNPRNTNINIRGLGSNVALTNDGLENGVGIYIDNVYYGRVGQSQFDLVDLQQIEVLRGPQGTLFGKNTTSGAINITSRLPSFAPEFSGEATIGDYGYHQVRGSVSAPILGDSVAFRLSLADTHRDGFLYNVTKQRHAQDYDNFTARGQLLIKPSEDVAIRLIGDYSQQRQNHVLNVFANYFGTYDNGAPILNNFLDRAARAGYTPLPVAPFERLGDADGHYQSNMEGYGLSGQLDWDFGKLALTSITAYRWWDWNPANDGDSTALPVITKAQQANRQRQFSQEIRLASTGSNTIDYVVGAYYFWQIIRGYGATAYGSAAANWNLPAVPAVVGNAALDGFEANSTSTPETKSYAVFGQADWNISDALKLTVGLRFTHEKKSGAFEQFHVAGVDLSTLPAAQAAAALAIRNQFNPVTSFSTSFSDDSLSGLISLSYRVAEDALLYGTYSRGNKSGGLNLTALPPGIEPDIRPEEIDNFEVGLKSQWLDRALTVNLAGFWTEVSDYQTAITEQVQNTVNFRQYIANIPKVRSRGFEADLVYAPTEFVSLTASAAYTDATYRDYRNAPQAQENLNLGGIQDLTGEQLSGVPKFTYTLGADLAQPVGEWGGQGIEVYGHGDFSHRSSFNTSATNSRFAQIAGYGLLNVRFGVRSDDDQWDLSVWARNLTDENYFLTLSPANTGAVTALVGEPRTLGVTLRTKL
ncbi:TonB-dependent receptor [Sphingomonas cavernae]|uniref:TonB-dependent receptor n=1 Tax=Sphingomonas cavernae TaxID=2320861 RepID=A0A418W760_9SPHN|nr:TonB-dependent receptor [Sphingomonas cavernae]RJF85808.1 TonB-dependent receptor [Sphingomonas cavernae]